MKVTPLIFIAIAIVVVVIGVKGTQNAVLSVFHPVSATPATSTTTTVQEKPLPTGGRVAGSGSVDDSFIHSSTQDIISRLVGGT